MAEDVKMREDGGQGGFYQRFAPETFTCTRCGEARNFIGQEDGICLRCRWQAKKEARVAARAVEQI
jgi:hypothetical protein